jgi:hypothetical protein
MKHALLKAGVLAGALAMAGATVGASAASASPLPYHPQHHKVAAASIEVNGEGYEQYQQFVALSGYGPNHGWESYTNDQYPMPGSGVWAPAPSTDTLDFQLNGVGSPYVHTLNGGGLTLRALGPNAVAFSGTGEYGTNPSVDPWTIRGTVRGDDVRFHITYGPWGGSPAYTVDGKGTIAPNGSAHGTATSSQNQNLTWTLGAGSFREVLRFVAPISSASIQVPGQNVSFNVTIPATWHGAPVPFAGAVLTLDAHNGHFPAADTFSQGVNGSPQVSETVEAGHILVRNA